ncbi:MAG TPA: thioredoxin domain-containing protein [Allosphingosinicella sp.]|nr:thioredoxin domain-containing protein [Allosphingosinicella sp.]
MKPFFLAVLAAAAAGAGAAAFIAAPAAGAAAQQDWTKIVAATPEGGFRVGNPAAPVKLVEYGSFTCDHCANFAREAMPQLIGKHVRSGRVSFEYRSFIRDPADLSAALLSGCAGPARYFELNHSYFAGQSQWIGRYAGMTEAQKQAIDALPQEQKLAKFAAFGGLDAIAAKAGVPPARAAQCLADSKAITRLVEMRKVAVDTHKVQGTPTFLVNGRTVDAHSWSALQPLLASPGG